MHTLTRTPLSLGRTLLLLLLVASPAQSQLSPSTSKDLAPKEVIRKASQLWLMNLKPTSHGFPKGLLDGIKVSSITGVEKASAGSTQNGGIRVSVNEGGGNLSSSGTTSNVAELDANNPLYACSTRQVRETVHFAEIPMFISSQSYIYPGALVNAIDIANYRAGNASLPQGVTRRPYGISVSSVGASGALPAGLNDTVGENYSLGAYNTSRDRILSRIKGTRSPESFTIEYIRATTKEETAAKLGFTLGASLPAELTALMAGIPLGANLQVDAASNSSQFSERSRLIVKVTAVNFKVDISVDNNEFRNLLSGPVSSIDNNLLVVNQVAYGSVGYIYFESTKEISELESVVQVALGVNGGETTGPSLEAGVNDTTKELLEAAGVTMRAFGIGYPLPPEGVELSDLEELINLITRARPWGPGNHGVPIGYTMAFVKSGIHATTSLTTEYPSRICTTAPSELLRYDVALELNNFTVNNVRDLDGGEDLYGGLILRSARAGAQQRSEIEYWSRSEKTAAGPNENSFVEGQREERKDRRVIFQNLSYQEVTNLEVTVKGTLTDDDWPGDRKFRMVGSRTGTRLFRVTEHESAISSINALIPGRPQAITIGDDDVLVQNFYENGKREDGHVKVQWKIFITAHP